MKFCGTAGMSASAASESDLLLGACWQSADHLLESKIIADHGLTPEKLLSDSEEMSPEEHRSTADILDTLLNSGNLNGNLAELKPLPPFTGYTGHLSINGIPGHHYHAIAQRLPEENNNYPTQSGYGSEQNVVSSSTCVVERESSEDTKFPLTSENDSKIFPPDNSEAKVFGGASADSCVDNQVDSPGLKIFNSNSDSCAAIQPKTEMYDISSIEDIAAIIGSAMADTTVSSQNEDPDQNCSRDSWMDLDAWIEGACGQNSDSKVSNQDNLSEFGLPHSPQALHSEFQCKMEFPSEKINKSNHDFSSKNQELFHKGFNAGSTLQTLLTHGYMPLLQNRLQNGPPVKQEAPSSTSYGMDIISTSSSPGNVVSTTDNLLLNGRYMQHHYALGLKPDGLCSPDHLMGSNYPHTTTTTPMSKSKRNRSQKKQQSLHCASSIAFQNAAELSGLLGKEKPVHRCNICNRGFLNKSNIKVHLRTHTGEKPFRCEVCAKAFRQKAHLIKHQQIHKRIGRD